MPPDSPPIEIDERWFEELFTMGWERLLEYLTGWAFFDAWCLDHPQEEESE